MTELRMVTVEAPPLTSEAWAPFGWIPVDDADPSDGAHTLRFDEGDAHLNVLTHTPDEVERTERGLVCAGLYRHFSHTQALLVLTCDAVVAVAPPGHDFGHGDGDGTGIEALRAFRLAPLDVFVLAPGTWHWGPFPIGDEPVRLLNLQGRGFDHDNDYADLAGLTGAVAEIATRRGG